MLKGGHRFFAVPYEVNGREWLKLETENVAPPLFSAVEMPFDRRFSELFQVPRPQEKGKLEEMPLGSAKSFNRVLKS